MAIEGSGTPDADSTLGVTAATRDVSPQRLHRSIYREALAMRKYAPSPATHYSSRDSLFLVAIAVVSLICGVVSFCVWRAGIDPSLTASVEDNARVLLPAGPRKYQ